MPELPEVENVRMSLTQLVGYRFERVRADEQQTRASLRRSLKRQISSVDRRGKYLLFALAGRQLAIHLGMSGRLFLAGADFEHEHLRWALDVSSGDCLVFVDRRRFGRFCVAPPNEAAFAALEELGPEPLDNSFTAQHLLCAANSTTRSLKSVLLDQRVVAGLGNIYVDEVLHAARIHPARVGLDEPTAASLVLEIKRILTHAIDAGGSSFSLHRDGLVPAGEFTARLRVFGRAGQSCSCGGTIKKIVHRGRGTHLCSRCQVMRGNGALKSG